MGAAGSRACLRPARPIAATEGDAEILRFLETQGFPAERCAHPDAVSTMNGRRVFVTQRVEGKNGREARGVRLFRTLGELLGRLQAMPANGSPAGSWHHLSFEAAGAGMTSRTSIAYWLGGPILCMESSGNASLNWMTVRAFRKRSSTRISRRQT
jgi:hypothetical protein